MRGGLIAGAVVLACFPAHAQTRPAPPPLVHPPTITNPGWRNDAQGSARAAVRDLDLPTGSMIVRCEFASTGQARACEPVGTSYDQASIDAREHSVAALFDGRDVSPMTVGGLAVRSIADFDVIISAPGSGEMEVGEPRCHDCFNQRLGATVPPTYARVRIGRMPESAEAQGHRFGNVILRCWQLASGAMSNCSVWGEHPSGFGLAEQADAAVREPPLRSPLKSRAGWTWFTAVFSSD